MEPLYYTRYPSPIGTMLLAATEKGLACLQFSILDPPTRGPLAAFEWIESIERTAPYSAELDEYFAGTRKEFTLPLDMRGTEFQKACWSALVQIPFGQTRSYAEIARQIGRPTAIRAVGSANHDNPVAVVVPCHRVVGTSGKLTGYAGGLQAKRQLLELEGAWTASLAL